MSSGMVVKLSCLLFVIVVCARSASLSAADEPTRWMALIDNDLTLLPEGAALCAALGVKDGEHCDDMVILERSQHTTNRDLWIGRTTSRATRAGAPGNCLRPIAMMSDSKGLSMVWACHEPDADDTVTELDLQRLRDKAKRLNDDPEKTLAKHQWIMSFKDFWTRAYQ